MVSKELIGACVLTRYNDKLYRVDDIEFNISPKDTFPSRDGGEVRTISTFVSASGLVPLGCLCSPFLFYRHLL